MSDVNVTDSIHGHEVMHLIHAAKPAHTRATLREAIDCQFGADATFHTCAASGMSLDDLLVFLMQRGKVVERDGRLQTDIGQMCQHG